MVTTHKKPTAADQRRFGELGRARLLAARGENREAGTVLDWSEVPGAFFYSVVRGDVRSLGETETSIDLGSVVCIETNSSAATTVGHEDGDLPAPGEAFFYLVAYNDGWESSYGTDTAAKPRESSGGGCR